MNIIEKIKTIIETLNAIDNTDLKKRLTLISDEVCKLSDENHELKEEIKTLKNIINTENSKMFINNCYAFGKEYPFCSRCYDVDFKKIRMSYIDDDWNGKIYRCPQCRMIVDFDANPSNLQELLEQNAISKN